MTEHLPKSEPEPIQDETPVHVDAAGAGPDEKPKDPVTTDVIAAADSIDLDGSSESLGAIFRRMGPAGPLAVVAALMPAVMGFALLSSVGPVGRWLVGLESWGLVIYIAAFALTSGLALLPTYAQAFVGGWAFKMLEGTPAALAGFGVGSLIGYEIAKRASGDRVLGIIESKPKWKAVYEAFLGAADEHGMKKWARQFFLVTLVRLPPNSPFALTNLVMASVGVPRLIYFLGTLIGMAPRTALVVWFGSSLQGELTKDALKEARPDWFLYVLIGSAIVMVLALNAIAQRALRRATGGPAG